MHHLRVTHLLLGFCLWVAFSAQSELETDEVVPRLLSGQEAHLSTDHSVRRRGQRSLGAGGGRHPDPDNIILTLPAFGTDLYLNLTRDATFLSRDFVVEERRRGQSSEVTRLSNQQLCFYSGSIINRTDSLVSLSTCGGLTGQVQIGADSWFIQPADKNNQSQSFSGLKHWLTRHRRSPGTSSSPPADQPGVCGTKQAGKRKERRAKANDERGKRNAIRLHEAYTVETVVVADSDMVHYHGAEAAQRFLLTVMNMVYNMFLHRSLGIRINIRVTKLVLLHSRPEKLHVGHHGERSLESFCQWQYQEFGRPKYLGSNHIPGARDDIPPVDTAVLVTRTDFCVHKDEPCDTVGIAYLGGVCSPKRKCVLAEDNGLNLAFTIAHELGHNMGMSHDDDHASCKGHSHIMSGEWVKGRNPSDLSWSSCSRDDLENFLRTTLKPEPFLNVSSSKNLNYQLNVMPELTVGKNEYKQFVFVLDLTTCPELILLSLMSAPVSSSSPWDLSLHKRSKGSSCLLHTDPRSRYQVRLPPKLPGMHYSVDEQCQILFGTNATFCSDMERVMPPVRPNWILLWMEQNVERTRPGPGGRHCQKTSVEHKACEGPPCPKGSPSFRDLQCLSYDRNANKKKGNLLTAVINDDKPCALFCTPVGRDVPALMAERVVDGTPCGPYEADLCVNGRCQKIGCDGVIGSSAKEDRCGICNGDGRSCKIVRGDFNHTKGMGYIEAVVIPAGARRIKVVEDKPSHSFLALKDSSKRSINSDWKIELPGEFELAGTTVRYVRRGLWEKMSAKGPTKTPLHLMVLLFHDQSYGFHYEYTVLLNTSQDRSNEEHREQEYLYIWTHSRWQDCTVQCGGGERRTLVSCMKIVNKTMEMVNDSYCQRENRPQPQVRPCNIHPCQYRWVTGEWGPCSVTCGKGLQQRVVVCVYHLQNGSVINTRDLYCQGGKPPVLQGCEGRLCLTVWEASEWSKTLYKMFVRMWSRCSPEDRRLYEPSGTV
ncbi:A disintegrin and metalloproteinase with thrombospondin motifs 17 [Cynoglossus semilaevis]|uniref:A disintegrin and metalloproteinase with thrombospondin motifs 17 n=1 Tax=Cynoglossus semilaevis TaxID=244447 RepID=UPI000D62EAA7|nr:A disintegrin and metalloproteinase with thrombospondin motifs 17 [Cynoglossus semilaevis]